ncbi:MAG: class I SAM-dependent methyltransferase [Alphaproteobacteria bacterium]|nr:MAG: class I SAM-dependent methyltransferase [Alphaproteobacteria bacterium]
MSVLALGDRLSGDDRDFFRRVWSTDPEVYRARIRAAGFAGLGDVLDAGCGFGQWTMPLAEANRSVEAIDADEARVDVARRALSGLSNVRVSRGSVGRLPYPDESFDGIFCYSVLYYTDHRRALAEFARVLRPDGRLYVCGNGLGWYLHNLIDGHNGSAFFDPRAMAAQALADTLAGRTGRQIVIPSEVLVRDCAAARFEVEAVGPEGTLAVAGEVPGTPFFKGTYHGQEGVYELIARKAR